MASCSIASQIKYDIFLSFRGTDTRRGFLSHLLKALNHNQIETFVDYKLNGGTEISLSLLRAIEESQISLIIFSRDYASSKWCLDELVKIIKCMKENGQIAIPVFYDVDPSWVRHQKGSYHDALAKHEISSGDKVQIWREALQEAANLSGFHSSNFGNDAEFIDQIVKCVLQGLNQTCQGDLQGLVGIHEPIAQLESLLCRESESVLIIGLWGMGGIGKTTLASVVFNRLCYEFQGFCYLDNVREGVQKYGINHLKKELLSKLLEEKDANSFITPGGITTFAKRRLHRKKVLIVLDDANDSDQLEDLCGGHKWFGPTSRIMVTTRDKRVLLKEADHIHEIKALNFDESLQLFNLNAFKQNYIELEQVELSMRVVNYAKGIPLALKVLGSFLYGKSKEEWESQLSKLQKMPHVKIQNILRVSYNELDRNDQNIFLYLACFFETTTEEQIKLLLDSCGYSTAIGLRNLQDKALISISKSCVTMHDLIREMGREVIREESPDDPGKRSRLWDPTDIYKVLKYNRGTEAIESITLNMSKIDVLSLDPQTFARMYKLKFLKIHSSDCKHKHRLCAPEGIECLSDELRIFHWDDYPLKSLPLSFCAENLVEIIMPHSRLEKLWEGVQNLVNLKVVDLKWSSHLIQLPDFSKASSLKEVDISNCKSLRQVPPSIVSHKLVELFLDDCNELSSFQHNIHLQSLTSLSFSNCTSLMKFSLTTYESPSRLAQLDTDTYILPSPLEELYFDYCYNLSMLPDNISTLSSLKCLTLNHSNVRSLPESIKHLSQLTYLNLSNCEMLQSLPELPSSIVELAVANCTSLETVFASDSTAELTKEKQSVYVTFAFANCIKLEEPAVNTIVANACARIKRAAHTCLATMEENEDGRAFNQHYYHWVRVCFPGRRVPDWFSYRTTQTLMTIELVPHASSTGRLLGFIFCVILALNGKGGDLLSLKCDYHIEASDGRSVRYKSLGFSNRYDLDEEGLNNNVYLWHDGQYCVDIIRGMKESKANDEGKTHKLKVSFHFYIRMLYGFQRGIKQCGVHPIYESDILNIREQWQMKSGLGIESKRRPEITEVGVTSINPRQLNKNDEDKKGGKVGKKGVPSIQSRPLLARSFAQRLASLFSTNKKWKKSKTKHSCP